MIKIDSDFPGGNIVVERIEGDTLVLCPDMRDTAGSWFYWAFRIRGAAGRRLVVRFSAHTPVGAKAIRILSQPQAILDDQTTLTTNAPQAAPAPQPQQRTPTP